MTGAGRSGVCRHGTLRRSCETCDLAEDLKWVEAERDALREVSVRTLAHLVAAVSLLERGGRKAAASDKMFVQMLADYNATIAEARANLVKPEEQP